jgi:fermentation-respiration switch protein FrsA (DUF1100 family)
MAILVRRDAVDEVLLRDFYCGMLCRAFPIWRELASLARTIPLLPVYWVMEDQFPVNDWIKAVTEPVLIAHGTADTTVDVSNGERLYELVPHKDSLWIVPDGTHGDLWDRGLWGQAEPFFERAEAAVGR